MAVERIITKGQLQSIPKAHNFKYHVPRGTSPRKGNHMKIDWTVPNAVLRFQAQTSQDLAILQALNVGPLSGARRLYEPVAESPLAGEYAAVRGWAGSALMRPPHADKAVQHILVGLEWDIRHQPAVGSVRTPERAALEQAHAALGRAVADVLHHQAAQAANPAPYFNEGASVRVL